ncbi:signal transducer and activator of transcription B-like [Vigna umbellata]|uniref:signal transducer and activator of transcription B-like n=1 Tax=Vigna umbellata TaxID=87088 RepID=UPI001F5F1019|nr:signal transducer and activator of transcription B-like [Vigna umbellata]XP_047175553.1 signal transducer and activator of transcription B-like [Vigna umbellata]XP_047175554.1 signal transducer and activator of transcription B-like [Vigna umbellata]
MELNPENSVIISNAQKAIIPHEEPKKINTFSSRKKAKGFKNFFKVALFMMRSGRSRKSKIIMDQESKNVWRNIVGSMRPLHMQTDQSTLQDNSKNIPQSQIMITSTPFANCVDPGDDAFDSTSVYTCSSSRCSSRYASAVGLNEMVQEAENEKDGVKENDNNNNNNNKGEEEGVKEKNNNGDSNDVEGDEMIDAKAEEFIAQFYLQMRLQDLNVVDSRYQEISMRSLGL